MLTDTVMYANELQLSSSFFSPMALSNDSQTVHIT